MKKVTKLLLVLLSLAVVTATLVIVASASSGNVARVGDKEYETLADALNAAAEGGEVVLIDDASIDTPYRVDKSVTIDLNGHSLDGCNNSFSVIGGITFTIKGHGSIYVSNTLINTDKDSVAAPTVIIDGSGYGIDVTAAAGVLTSSKAGTLKFKNLNVTATATPSNRGVFHNDANSDAEFEFVAVEVVALENPSNNSSILRFGNSTYAKFDYCHFATNRTVFNLNDCKTTNLVMEANNSYFAARSKAVSGNKLHEIGVFGTYAGISCKIVLNNTVVEGSFRPVCVNATSDALITLNNSAIKNNGIQGADIVRTCNIVVNPGSMITTVAVPSSGIIHTTAEDDKTYIILMEGARMNKNIYDALYVNKNNYGIRYGTKVVDDEGFETLVLETLGETVGEEYVANVNYTAIYDPAGNVEAPYVVVKRTYDENGAETTPAGESREHVLYSNNYAGFPVGVIWDNGSSGPCDVPKAAKPNSDFLGWNKQGILSGAQFGGNGAIRYTFDEPNEKNNGTTIMFADTAGGYAHNAYKVFVAEGDFAFDGEHRLAGTLSLCGRGASNGGNYSSDTKITLTTDGKATLGDNSIDLKYGEWNRVTIVIYSDTETVGTSSKGKAYYYVNGQLLGEGDGYKIGTSNGDVAYLWGLRCDVNANDNEVGATILFDNTYFAAYTDYKVDSSDDPLSYSASEGKAVNTGKANANVTVAGLPMGTLNDALALGNSLGVYPQLKSNLMSQTVTENGTVRANGYSVEIEDGSNAALVKYTEADEVYTYNFNSQYNGLSVKYQWYIGNKNNVSDLKNPAMYVETVVPIGTTPAYPDGELAPGTKHIGQDIYTAAHIGWSADLNAETPDVFGAVSVSDAVNMADTPIRVFPVYEAEYTKVTGFNVVILDVNGNFARGVNTQTLIYGSDWTTRAGKAIKLDYGETMVLMTSALTFVGNFNSPRANVDNPKTFAIDLNGYTMNIDAAVNTTGKTPNYFQVKKGETFYFYSSVPGAAVNVRGTNDSVTSVTGGRLFNVQGSGSNTVLDNISDETNNNTHLKIGTVTRFGETYPGSNLTISGDTLVELSNGDKTCSVEIDGITYIKAIQKYGAVIINNYFNGSVSVKNSNFFIPNGGTFLDGKNSGITDVNGDGTRDKYDVDNENAVRVAATAVIDGCFLLTASNGTSDVKGNLSAGDYTFKSILYTNCVTNGRIGGSNTGLAIRIGDNCCVYNPAATKADGVTNYTYNRNMTIGNTDLETVTVKYVSSISGSGTKVTYNYSDFTYAVKDSEATNANLVLPYFQYKFVTSENVFEVTFTGADGSELKTETYAKGAFPILPTDIGTAPANVATKRVYDGTFAPELPDGVTSDVTLAPNYTVQENLEGLKANLFVNSDFNVNLIIPIAYKDYVTSVYVGESELEIIENTDGIVVSIPVAVTDVTETLEFVIAISEAGNDVTKTVKYSVAEYAEEILKNEEAKYTAADRKLVWYVVNYAQEAALYFEGEADEALEALLTAYEDAKGEPAERAYANVIEDHGLSAVFTSAAIKLTEAPVYTFTVKAGFAGTVVVTTSKGAYTLEVEASEEAQKLVIEGMKAFELAETASITATGTIGEEAVAIDAGSFNLATFANYHSQNAANSTDSAEALDLINALYDYVTLASDYTNG